MSDDNQKVAKKDSGKDALFWVVVVSITVIAIIYFVVSAFLSFAHSHPIIGTIVVVILADIMLLICSIASSIGDGDIGTGLTVGIFLFVTFVIFSLAAPILLTNPIGWIILLLALGILMALSEQKNRKKTFFEKNFFEILIVTDVAIGSLCYSIFS